MRISGGKFRGRLLKTPPDCVLRPTQDAVREALFSMLASFLPGRFFLDLFAGTGAVGLEAESRGASGVAWVEKNPKALKALEANVAALCGSPLPPRLRVFRSDVAAWLARPPLAARSVDVVFADPPYPKSMEMLVALTSDDAFNAWTRGAVFYWELPDFQCALRPPSGPWKLTGIRQLGAANFMKMERTD